ncbi:MAG: valine--tRNA ligase [Elusimicrobiota bacterium]
MEISKIYEPKEVEAKWLKEWEEKKLFHSDPDSQRVPFTIVIPPPNVTGSLHIGHGLNNLLQDIIIRFKRMNGFNACWIPGTDHGGIATQNVIEKELKKNGKKRDDFTREEFTKIMVDWAQKTSGTILSQLKKLGCSCDWDKIAFTMDEKRAKAVNYAFIKLYEKGLIYRDTRFVDWCPRCETALNESEVEQEDEKGKLWYIKYPLEDSSRVHEFTSSRVDPRTQESKNPRTDFIVVATTRPETMLGDTAVAVNPNDERYKKFIGKNAMLPLVNRIIPIIADETVDMKFGTGAVKITPAHDLNDDAMAKRHNLVYIDAIDKKAKITSNIILDLKKQLIENNEVSDIIGKDRDEARKILIEMLKEKQFLEKEENYIGPKKRCYRCDTIVESFNSEQWFLKMSDMAKRAIESAKNGKTKFFPEKWLKPYLLWLENLKDWCISRQIWWGHRIPLWYCKNSSRVHEFTSSRVKSLRGEAEPSRFAFGEAISSTYEQTSCSPIPSVEKPEKCPNCGDTNLTQDSDVLDTWFSSALWPMSVFGWPDKDGSRVHEFTSSRVDQRTKEPENPRTDLDYYYPTNVLVTGHEILYLWVARMIMLGLEFKNEVPYKDVYIHGIVRDSHGKKMSKSLGNVIDPLIIMEKYGTDALRFALAYQGIPGRDMQIADEHFIMARNFANKLWNVSKFVLMNVPQSPSPEANLLGNLLRHRRTYSAISFAIGEPTRQSPNLESTDKWILSELNLTIKNVTKAIENYNPSEASRLLYEFIRSKYCDWYVEFSKTRLYGTDEKLKLTAQKVHFEVLENILKLIHPIMPFITEEIFQNLQKQNKYLMVSDYPKFDITKIDETAEKEIQKVIDIITAIRNIRSVMNIKLSDTVDIVIKISSEETEKIVSENRQHINLLAKVKDITFTKTSQKPELSASAIVGDIEIFVLLEGQIDFDKERKRLETQLAKINQELKIYDTKLSNKNFIEKANPEEVERIKQKFQETENKRKKIGEVIKNLGS